MTHWPFLSFLSSSAAPRCNWMLLCEQCQPLNGYTRDYDPSVTRLCVRVFRCKWVGDAESKESCYQAVCFSRGLYCNITQRFCSLSLTEFLTEWGRYVKFCIVFIQYIQRITRESFEQVYKLLTILCVVWAWQCIWDKRKLIYSRQLQKFLIISSAKIVFRTSRFIYCSN